MNKSARRLIVAHDRIDRSPGLFRMLDANGWSAGSNRGGALHSDVRAEPCSSLRRRPLHIEAGAIRATRARVTTTPNSWSGLYCTSYADERLVTDRRTEFYDARRYWCGD